ncbi:hypothetical protein TorRG33x02_208410, partial [Trema orientale]
VASKKGAGGIGGRGGNGGRRGSGGSLKTGDGGGFAGVTGATTGFGLADVSGAATGGGLAGVTGAGTGSVDFGQFCIGWEGCESNESAAYISMSNILNISLSFCAGPAAAEQPDSEAWPLSDTCAKQPLRSGAPSNFTA